MVEDPPQNPSEYEELDSPPKDDMEELLNRITSNDEYSDAEVREVAERLTSAEDKEDADKFDQLADMIQDDTQQSGGFLQEVKELRAIQQLGNDDGGGSSLMDDMLEMMKARYVAQIMEGMFPENNGSDDSGSDTEEMIRVIKAINDLQDDGDDGGSDINQELMETVRDIGEQKADAVSERADFWKEQLQQQQEQGGDVNQKLIQRLNSLENQLQERQEEGKDLSDQLEEYKQLKDTLGEIA
ncbi:MAG: hypothetical protein ABEK12_02660, partial [Candidatus Nanohaloarchaea archaeon]